MRNLTLIGNEAWTLMREGEAEKQVIFRCSIAVHPKLDALNCVNFSYVG